MRAVVQRVSRASVTVDGEIVGAIERGLCVLVGAADGDDDKTARTLADKVANLRIFQDDDGKMNRSVLDIGGGVLAVSQFTLLGDARKGRRPTFITALEPVAANQLYEAFVARLRECDVTRVECGVFRADMLVELVNDGPVTILLDTTKLF